MKTGHIFTVSKRVIQRPLCLHLLFWTFIVTLNYYRYSQYSILTKNEVFSLAAGLAIILAIPSYVNNYFLNLFLFRKKYLAYGASCIGVIVLWTFINQYIVTKVFFIYSTHFSGAYNLILIVTFTTGLSIIKKAITDHYRLQVALTQQIQAELHLLKAQINPHFLFNTLNNLYSLTLDKSDQAPDIVLKLAALMRYMLETVKKNSVKLTEELAFINNYVELEKIRLKKNDNILISTQIDNEDIELPPMLFIPFIENAFKHGVNESTGDFFVTITIYVDATHLFFSIDNSIPLVHNPHRKTTQTGLQNIKRRLDIIYGNKYELSITEKSMIYSVRLRVPLYNEGKL